MWKGKQDIAIGTRGYSLRTVFFCLKEYHSGKASITQQQGREVAGLGQHSTIKNHRCKVDRTLHEEQEVTGLG